MQAIVKRYTYAKWKLRLDRNNYTMQFNKYLLVKVSLVRWIFQIKARAPRP